MTVEKNNSIIKFGKVVIEVGVLLFAVAIAWATLRGTVKENTKDIEKHDVRITHTESDVTDVKSDIRVIRYILEGKSKIK